MGLRFFQLCLTDLQALAFYPVDSRQPGHRGPASRSQGQHCSPASPSCQGQQPKQYIYRLNIIYLSIRIGFVSLLNEIYVCILENQNSNLVSIKLVICVVLNNWPQQGRHFHHHYSLAGNIELVSGSRPLDLPVLTGSGHQPTCSAQHRA